MRRCSLTVTLALALATLSGCSKLLDTADLDPLKDAAGACRTLADVVTSYQVRCGVPILARETDLAYRAMVDGTCEDLVAAERAGRVRYDRAAAGSCMESLSRAVGACADLSGPAEGCAPWITPAVPLGGACTSVAECMAPADGCYAGNQCLGTCMAPGGLGEACGAPWPGCAEGFYCAGATGCQPLVAMGGQCPKVDACAAGSYCLSGLCVAYLGEGDVCSSGGLCASGLFCNWVVGRCEPWRRPGDDCSPTAGRQCDPALGYCLQASSFTCTAWPAAPGGGDGEPCGVAGCKPGFYCDEANPQPAVGPLCRAQGGLDATCDPTVPSACLFPYGCMDLDSSMPGATGKCSSGLEPGQPCTAGASSCKYGAHCPGPGGMAGACTLNPGVGGTCGQVGVERIGCFDSWCRIAEGATTGTCTAFLPLDAPCNPDALDRPCGHMASCDPVSRTCARPCALWTDWEL